VADSLSSPATASEGSDRRLPAERIGPDGSRHVDYRAIGALAFPLMLNSGLQVVISLTDTWFIGHISTTAMAGIAAIYWIVLFFVMVFGGIGLAVQTIVAQAVGGRRRWRAGHAAWVAMWGSLITVPFFAAFAWLGGSILSPFGLDAAVHGQAVAFWWPRMIGAPLGVALWAILGFFNGIARPRVTVMTSALVAIVNAVLNEVFIFQLGWGIAGAAWATNVSMLSGLVFALSVFLREEHRREFRSHLTWRPDARSLLRQFRIGLPMGLMYAADLFGISLFQLMQVRLGQVDGAATQIVMMLTSAAYMPGLGIALAGTTLVGQAIGAGDKDWARKLGNTIILLTVAFMGTIGVLLAALGPWVLPAFAAAGDPLASAVVELGIVLLWIAAGYQIFDGLNLSAGFALRGAGDVRVPAVLFVVLSWGVFVPLAHMLSFAPGKGWVDALPQFGLGAVGGWFALLTYVLLLGGALYLRWRSGAWRKIRL
jgi:MATE family multidrug resistance protein